jgi:HlyD family secretion protein
MAGAGGSNRLQGDGRPALPLPGGRLGGVRGFGTLQNVLLGLALLLGGLGGYYGFTHFYESANQPPATGQPVRVTRTTIRNTVSATGTVTATEQSNLTFQTSGQITDIFVKSGDVLQQGQPIAALDSRTATIARDQAKSALATAHAKLDALLAGATPDVVAAARQAVVQATSGLTTSASNVTTSQATLTKSQNDLTALLNGPTPTDIEQVQAAVDSAQANLNIAQANFDKLVSHSDLATRSETTTLAVAKQNYETAQANYLNKLTPPISSNVAQAQTNVKLARDAFQTAQLKNLQVQADPTAGIADKLASQNQVTSASAAVDAAQAALQLLQQGTDQTDIAAAQSQVDNARVALQSAQANYNNLVALSDLVSRPEYSSLSQARSQYATAKASYDAKLAPPQPTDVSSGQAAVSAGQAAVQSSQAGIPSSQASLQAAQAKLTQTIGPPLPTDVTQATEAVNTAQLALQNAQLALDNDTLVAPFAGTVISVPANIGNQVTSATVITTLVNPGALEVDANVDETSVTQLKAGQQATVTLDALPGRTFPATVAAVTPSGTTQQGVVVFPIVFRLDTQGQQIPAGASANITVVTATTPNVLAVPSRYVHRVGADNVVDVLVNNKRDSKVVTTGVTNGQLTEIRSGLQVGDVAIPPQQTRGGATFGAGGNVGGGGPPAP